MSGRQDIHTEIFPAKKNITVESVGLVIHHANMSV